MLRLLLSAFIHTEYTPVELSEKDIQEISSGSSNQIDFSGSFAGIALKLEKVGPIFSSFNPRPFVPSV